MATTDRQTLRRCDFEEALGGDAVCDVTSVRKCKWGLGVNKWSDMKCSVVEWTDGIYVKWLCFEVKWSEVSYGEVPGDKSALYVRVTL